MAISIIDQPYAWAVRGQKLMIIASSNNTGNTGFRYGIEVTIDTKTYSFLLPAAPDDRLYFDLQSLVDDMRNQESTNQHFASNNTQNDGSKKVVNFTLSEWWIVGGIMTQAEGSEVSGDEMIVINGYFQVTDGYKPNVESGDISVRYSLSGATARMMSDRTIETSPFYYAYTWGFGANTVPQSVWIPVYESDYGILLVPGNNDYLPNSPATKITIQMTDSAGAYTTQDIIFNGYDVEGLPVYPANLNDWVGLTVKPSLFPNWRYYTVAAYGPTQKSEAYIFYNAAVYGQKDCRYDNVRLGWVNSRGGWDYFNFIKKSETTDEIERKKYRKVLFNGTTTVFSKNDRGLQERRNLVQQVIAINSDYITEGEFLLLRSLVVSNQVSWLTRDAAGDPIAIPVNIDDTSYTEKNTRDGKLYNVTLKIRIANNYWS